MIVRTWTSEAEIPRFKHFLSHSTVVRSWERNLQQFYCLMKEGRLIILSSTVIPLYAPSSLSMRTSKWPGGILCCRFNGSLPVSFVGTPHPPSIAQEPGSPSSLAEPTGMRTMRSVSESLEVVGRASLGKSGKQKEKAYLRLSWPARVLKFLFWIANEKSR